MPRRSGPPIAPRPPMVGDTTLASPSPKKTQLGVAPPLPLADGQATIAIDRSDVELVDEGSGERARADLAPMTQRMASEAEIKFKGTEPLQLPAPALASPLAASVQGTMPLEKPMADRVGKSDPPKEAPKPLAVSTSLM